MSVAAPPLTKVANYINGEWRDSSAFRPLDYGRSSLNSAPLPSLGAAGRGSRILSFAEGMCALMLETESGAFRMESDGPIFRTS